jgi:flagellar hook-basal body complex protein FliE
VSGFDVLGPIGSGGASGPLKPYGAKPFGVEKMLGVEGGDGSKVEGSFSNTLTDALSEVRELQLEAADKSQSLASGEPVEIHDLMISMGKSEVAFNLMLEVRNKLLEAWQSLKRSVS